MAFGAVPAVAYSSYPAISGNASSHVLVNTNGPCGPSGFQYSLEKCANTTVWFPILSQDFE